MYFRFMPVLGILLIGIAALTVYAAGDHDAKPDYVLHIVWRPATAAATTAPATAEKEPVTAMHVGLIPGIPFYSQIQYGALQVTVSGMFKQADADRFTGKISFECKERIVENGVDTFNARSLATTRMLTVNQEDLAGGDSTGQWVLTLVPNSD